MQLEQFCKKIKTINEDPNFVYNFFMSDEAELQIQGTWKKKITPERYVDMLETLEHNFKA